MTKNQVDAELRACDCAFCACPHMTRSVLGLCFRCAGDTHQGERRQMPLRVEQCACGVRIVAHNDQEAIARAVRIHNGSAIHRNWSAMFDRLYGYSPAPQVGATMAGRER